MPRLFTGLEVPPEIAARLALRRGGLPGARWIDPADYHVTLSFIGDVDNRKARDIVDSLDAVRRPSPEVTIDRLDAFGGPRPRSVHAAVVPEPALADLQSAQELALRRVGVAVDSRQFRPHVTLARLHGRVSARQVIDWLGLYAGDELRFRTGRFVLYSSRDSTGGGPYLVEAAFPLG